MERRVLDTVKTKMLNSDNVHRSSVEETIDPNMLARK